MRRLHAASLLPAMLLLIATGTANAVSLTSVATSFTGDPLDILLTFDETAEGDILVTAEVIGGMEGDIRAVFLNISNDALLADLEITGDLVTGTNTSGSVDDMRRGANLRGGGTPCPCDLGVAFGSPGIGKDDLQIVSFTLSHPDVDLDLSLVAGQLAGVRVTSVGDGGDREGSSKTVALVPEPSTAALSLLGLWALAWYRSRGRPTAA